MNLPLISIITPTYNAASTVEQNLSSIINQRYKTIEHIFIDGCSTDATLSIIRDYQCRYNHIQLYSEKDNGIYHAINKGLDLCKGDWIYIMGADDEFYNEDVLSDLVGQGFFQGEQIVYGDVIIRGDSPWAKNNTIYDGPFSMRKLFRRNICHQSVFYPRSVIELIGYYAEEYTTTADWDYNLRCFAKYKFTFADQIIAFFSSGGKSSKIDDFSFDKVFLEKVVEYFQLDLNEKSYHDIKSNFYFPVSRYCVSLDKKTIRELMDETERLNQQVLTNQNAFNTKLQSLCYKFTDLTLTNRSASKKTILNDEATYDLSIHSGPDDNERHIKEQLEQFYTSVGNLTTEHTQLTINIREEQDAVWKRYTDKNEGIIQLYERAIWHIDHLKEIIEDLEQNLGQTIYLQKKELDASNAIVSLKQAEIDSIFHSLTWKTGKTLLAPAIFIAKKINIMKNHR